MVKVEVEQGWLEGEVLDLATEDGQYFSFKGIPYAAPPLGKLRFMEPQPPEKWNGVRKATSHGHPCYQKDIFFDRILSNGSEDCLYLNVYSPSLTPSSPLPVMVFIHGGGFKSGSGNTDFYGPDFLVQENVVLVTINYRLEVLGFLCLDIPEVPGNAGLKDQVAALKWIKSNISNFGGDPSNVTIFGESAGGASTAYHLLSPMSKNLFSKAISMSGVPLCDWALPFQPQMRAFVLGKQLGLTTEDPYELLEFLQKVPADKLIDTKPCVLISEGVGNHPLKMYHFTPVVERNMGQNAFLLEEPLKTLISGQVNDANVLIGHTQDEAIIGLAVLKENFYTDFENYTEMYVPRRILNKKSQSDILEISHMITRHYFGNKPFDKKTLKEFVKYASDITFIYPIHKFLSLLHKANKGKCYFYKFSAFSERNVFGNQKDNYDIAGTAHLDDLMYLFKENFCNIPIIKESKSYKMIKQTCKLFSNFAKYGNPTPDSSLGVVWPHYDEETKHYVDIGEQLTLGNDNNKDVVEFWDKVYEVADVCYGSFY